MDVCIGASVGSRDADKGMVSLIVTLTMVGTMTEATMETRMEVRTEMTVGMKMMEMMTEEAGVLTAGMGEA